MGDVYNRLIKYHYYKVVLEKMMVRVIGSLVPLF